MASADKPPRIGSGGTARLVAGASKPARRARTLRNLLLLAGLGAIAFAVYTAAPRFLTPATPQRSLAVRMRKLASSLHEIGTVSAHIERPVLTRFSGEIVWRAEDGTPVDEGDPVVVFDSKLLQDEVELREKDLSDKVDEVKRAERNIELTKRKNDFLIKQKEIDLQKAELDRKTAYDYPLPDDLLDFEITWKSAKAQADLLKIQTESLVALGKEGFASVAEVKKKQLDYANAKAEAARSKLVYDITKQGKTPEQKRVTDLAVADAKKALNVAKFNAKADQEACESALQLARIELIEFQRVLKRRQMRLDAATVRAPIRGRVIFQPIYKGSEKNRAPVQAGDTRPEGSDLCTVLDTSSLVILLWINEMDIGNVRVGQKAQVTLPAVPGPVFSAEVAELAVTAQDKNIALSPLALRRSGEAFVNVVRVKLNFGDIPEEVRNHIRVGFTADVRLFTGDERPALSVPWQAVGNALDGTPFVDVLSGGKTERRVVKLGRSDNANVEILEGLSDNMRVIDQSNSSIPFREELIDETRGATEQKISENDPGTEAVR